jgi:hypothetical protein
MGSTILGTYGLGAQLLALLNELSSYHGLWMLWWRWGLGIWDIQPALGIRAGRHCPWQIDWAHRADGLGNAWMV